MIVSAELHGWTVVLDEGRAWIYAEGRGLGVLCTQDLVLEMAAAGQVAKGRAYGLYRRVYRGATRAAFDGVVTSVATALGFLIKVVHADVYCICPGKWETCGGSAKRRSAVLGMAGNTASVGGFCVGGPPIRDL